MTSLAVASLLFACMLTGALVAMAFARRLPGHHLSSESKDVVKLGLGVIATLTALVLGLLVAATKGTYDAQGATVREAAAQFALLDRILARYGSDAQDARVKLKTLAIAAQEQIWPKDGSAPTDFSAGQTRNPGEAFFEAVAALEPKNDVQRMLKSRAMEGAVGLAQIRQRMVVNQVRSIPVPFLIILGFWQTVLFAGFGLLAPRNATTVCVLIVCMLSVSAAIFLVLELDRPFEGFLRVSDAPLQVVLSHLGE